MFKKSALLMVVVFMFFIGGCSKSEDSNAPSSQPSADTMSEEASSTPEVMEQLEQAKESVTEYGKEVVGEAVEGVKDMASEEVNKKVGEVKEKIEEVVDEYIPDNPETDAMKDMLKEKAESEGIKMPTLP